MFLLIKIYLSHKTKTIKLKDLIHIHRKNCDSKKQQIKLNSNIGTEVIYKITDKIDEYEKVLRNININYNIDTLSTKELRTKILQQIENSTSKDNNIYSLIDKYIKINKLSSKSI
jgi:hypothetical protein